MAQETFTMLQEREPNLVTGKEAVTWGQLQPMLQAVDQKPLLDFYGQLSSAELRQCYCLLESNSQEKSHFLRLSSVVGQKIHDVEIEPPGCASSILGVGGGAAALGSYIYLGIWLVANRPNGAGLPFYGLSVFPMACLSLFLMAVIGGTSSMIGDYFNKELTALKELRREIDDRQDVTSPSGLASK